jgi:hypothetical protein
MSRLTDYRLLGHALVVLGSIPKNNRLSRIISGRRDNPKTAHVSILHRFFFAVFIVMIVIHEYGITSLSLQVMMRDRWRRIHDVVLTVQVLDHTRHPFPDEFTVLHLMRVFSHG